MSSEAPSYLRHSNELIHYWENYTSAGVLIANKTASKVLLGNQSEAPHKWSNFAGHKELGEIPPQTALRELKEESGIDLTLEQLGRPLIVVDSPKIGIIFPAQINERSKIILPQNGEILSVKWFTPDMAMEWIVDQIDIDYAYDSLSSVWGKQYTIEALMIWMQNRSKFMSDFCGVTEIDAHPAFS